MEDPPDTTKGKSPLKYLWEVKKIKQCSRSKRRCNKNFKKVRMHVHSKRKKLAIGTRYWQFAVAPCHEHRVMC